MEIPFESALARSVIDNFGDFCCVTCLEAKFDGIDAQQNVTQALATFFAL